MSIDSIAAPVVLVLPPPKAAGEGGARVNTGRDAENSGNPAPARAKTPSGKTAADLDPRTLISAQEQVDRPGLPKQAEARETAATDISDPSGLTDAEKKQVREMQQRDREVRAHEQAHARVGGQYAGSPSYQLEKGPDGRSYAVAGEVPIDVSPIPGDPDATIRKMEVVIRAANAPAEPSSQDRSVAARAEATKQQARVEKLELDRQERTESGDGTPVPSTSNAESPEIGKQPEAIGNDTSRTAPANSETDRSDAIKPESVSIGPDGDTVRGSAIADYAVSQYRRNNEASSGFALTAANADIPVEQRLNLAI